MPRPSQEHRVPFPQLFTLAEISARTHLPRDTIQRWGNIGLLMSESGTTHAGKGVHRQFRGSELVVAALLRPFSLIDVPAGQLARLAGVLRTSPSLQAGMARGVHYEEGVPLIRQALHRGLYTRKETYLAIAFGRDAIAIAPIFNVDPDDDKPAEWRPAALYRAAGKTPPDSVHLIDLAILYGLLGDPPPDQSQRA